VNELRELLQRQVNKDKAVSDSLQREVSHLQSCLNEAKTQSEMLNEKYQQLIEDNVQLRDLFDHISDDQALIQDIARKQQEYLEAARAIRAELIQTLLKQEDTDGENDRMRGTKLVEIADGVQRRIHDFVGHHLNNGNSRSSMIHCGGGTPPLRSLSPERRMAPMTSPRHRHDGNMMSGGDNKNSSNIGMGSGYNADPDRNDNSPEVPTGGGKGLSVETRKGPSRVEVERGNNDEEVELYYVVQGEDAGNNNGGVVSPGPSGAPAASGAAVDGDHHNRRTRRDPLDEYADAVARAAVAAGGGGDARDDNEEDYGEVRILGDEISAITENSAY